MPRQTASASFFLVAISLAAGMRPSHADTVYVASFTTGALVRYDSTNPAGTAIALSGSGSLSKPAALAMGADGNLYIGEAGDGATIAPRISRFNLSTNSLSTVTTFAAFDVFPGSIAFKGSDMLIGRNPFFGNTGPIVKLTGWNGGSVATSDYTSGGGLASSPGLAVAADGTLYVSDQSYDFLSGIASGPVKRFDAAGAYVGEVIASGSSGLFGPTGLAIDGSTLYVASIMNGTVLRTSLGSDVTQAFASTGGQFEVGPLALLADGGILAGSPAGTGSIYRFAPWGELVSTYPSGLGQIGGIVAVAAVPEPSTVALAAGGLTAVLGHVVRVRRRRGA